jgi:hypothetical protein
MENKKELMNTSEEFPESTEEFPEPAITTAKYQANAENAAVLMANNCNVSETAAKIGISRKTLNNWMKTDHFQALFESKKADRRLMIEKKILEAAEGKNWTAGAWLLERSPVFREEYCQPKSPPPGSGNVQINIILSQAPNGHGKSTITLSEQPMNNDKKENI